MTIPKNGQRLETSTSCFYQPQRRSVILDGRSGRQIEWHQFACWYLRKCHDSSGSYYKGSLPIFQAEVIQVWAYFGSSSLSLAFDHLLIRPFATRWGQEKDKRWYLNKPTWAGREGSGEGKGWNAGLHWYVGLKHIASLPLPLSSAVKRWMWECLVKEKPLPVLTSVAIEVWRPPIYFMLFNAL